MKRILSRLALLGIVAAGALGASLATSAAQSCAYGSTDCQERRAVSPLMGPEGMRPEVGRPDLRPERPGRPDWRPERPERPGVRPERPGRPDWRPDDRPDRQYWRPDRDQRPRWDRYRPPRYYPDRRRDRDWYYRPRSGIYFNYYVDRYPDYYDDYYVEPQPRYVVPRYRVRNLSAAHVEWCYARYKTYRASDNTFKPTRHTRRQCISPYS